MVATHNIAKSLNILRWLHRPYNIKTGSSHPFYQPQDQLPMSPIKLSEKASRLKSLASVSTRSDELEEDGASSDLSRVQSGTSEEGLEDCSHAVISPDLNRRLYQEIQARWSVLTKKLADSKMRGITKLIRKHHPEMYARTVAQEAEVFRVFQDCAEGRGGPEDFEKAWTSGSTCSMNGLNGH